MREGDIYRWRWADDALDRDHGPYRAYHCFSQRAVVENGLLRDTFWSATGKTRLDPDTVILTLVGNSNDMTKIRESEARYYRGKDVVNMRHSNDSRAPIYLQPGAEKDRDTMLEYIRRERDQADSDARFAASKIERMDGLEKMVIAGNLDDVHF